MAEGLRKGFTTGSCAAAAAKAACWMLLAGGVRDKVSIVTPKGEVYDAEILNIEKIEDAVRCAVRKDGGDDPDVTSGALIEAEVRMLRNDEISQDPDDENGRVIIDGGAGVGRVTRPGLDQPVGMAAINSVPREMIRREVTEVMELFDFGGKVSVTISVPGGEEIAQHTFNPRLGIEGGISIIGTSGIVEPMSKQAIIDTIRVELRQKRAEGHDIAFISPGNYGLDFMKESYGIDLDRSVKCSNFIGETVDMICDLGFRGMLLTGHAGKLVKVAGGIMNTHSREADCRMEIIAAAAAREGAGTDIILRILDSLTTEEAYSVLFEAGLAERVSSQLMKRIIDNLDRRAKGRLDIGCIMYSKDFGQLAASERAAAMIEENRDKWNG
ncbi:MAG: cobalamin biosynthesis protein CbiD [Mogibacterium sp.]|nr:cobalamin biosynthesis protein CbiD [Mogibacterium sp.]